MAAVLFSGISGTAVADIAALGRIFINAMPREGYSKAFAAALVTAGSVIGPIIPPSVIMVIYGAVAEISVLRLFLGGVVPGILLGVACGVVVFIKGIRGELPPTSLTYTGPERSKALREGLLVLSLPAFIVFGTLPASSRRRRPAVSPSSMRFSSRSSSFASSTGKGSWGPSVARRA